MVFNTDSLCYDLLNGKLKKHSEQLNKVVAGLFDSDGCVSIKFSERGNSSYKEEQTYEIQLTSQIDQAASNDPDLQVMRALHKHYEGSCISYRARENWAHSATVSMNGSKAVSFFYLIGKHLMIKGTHYERMVQLYTDLKGVSLSRDAVMELKEYITCSRDNSTSLKPKKHVSPAYLAGLLAGDGWITVKIGVPRIRNGWTSFENSFRCAISLHFLDSDVLSKIQRDYGGKISKKDKNMVCWKRNLGKADKAFALRFIKDIQKFMLIEKKYIALNSIYRFHTVPAETKCLSSERRCDSPRR